MKTLLALLLLSITTRSYAQEIPVITATDLNEHLAIFKPMIGNTYKGIFAGSTPEKPTIDIATWERALNGQAIRSLHSVNNGEYGGESIIMWDPKEEKLTCWYFTTAGFFTKGHFEIKNNTWTSIEEVTGNANGITKVKSTGTINPDGSMTATAEFFKSGQWVPGHTIHYTQDPAATVIFK